jgi:hypothetical protein
MKQAAHDAAPTAFLDLGNPSFLNRPTVFVSIPQRPLETSFYSPAAQRPRQTELRLFFISTGSTT